MRHLLTVMTAAASLASAAQAQTVPAPTNEIAATISRDMDGLLSLYRDLHANPELSEQEDATAAKLARRLKAMKFDVTEKVGGTGVVAIMKNGSGPVLLVRADMDALPVTEQTGLPFASKVRAKTAEGVETGVMHACGHDTHMTAFIETARLLSSMRINGEARSS